MGYNNARRLRGYKPQLSKEVELASVVIRAFIKKNRDIIIVEKWHDLFTENEMPEIAAWLQEDICPRCLVDNILQTPQINHCLTCGYSWQINIELEE